MIFRFTLSYNDQAVAFPILSDFENSDPGNEAWTLGTTPSVSPTTSKLLRGEIDGGVSDVQYQINYDLDVSSLTGGAHNLLVRIRLYDSAFTTYVDDTTAVFFTNGNKTGFVNLTPTFIPAYIVFLALQSSGSGASVQINSYSGEADVTVSDSLVISEPDGWAEAVLKLERDDNFHSLIEHFEGDFIFYGDNGVQNGGIDFIKYVESNYGPDADLEILIEISFDGYTYEEVFNGLLDLSTIVEMKDNLLQCAIIRNDFWTKFITRQETVVDLQSYTNVDGNPVTVYDSVNLSMLPQVLQAKYIGRYDMSVQIGPMLGTSADFGIIDFDIVELDEISQKFNYPVTFTGDRPFELFAMEYAGDYLFDIHITLSYVKDDQADSRVTDALFAVKIQVNNDTAVNLTETNIDLGGGYFATVYTYNGTLSLNRGDFVYLYIEGNGDDGSYTLWYLGDNLGLLGPPEFSGLESYLEVTGQTVFAASNAEGFLLHDAGAHITDRIIGSENTFYSEFLGGVLTLANQYGSDGCAWFYMLLKGLQIRQYSLLEKPFFMSFKQWWEGANPILNLGLGYETISRDGQVGPNPSFAALSSFQNSGSGIAWSTGANPSITMTDESEGDSQLLIGEITNPYADIPYTINYDVDTTGIAIGSFHLNIRIYDGSLTTYVVNDELLTGNGNHADSVILTPTFIPKYVVFVANRDTGGFGPDSATLDINSYSASATAPAAEPELIEVIRVEEKSHFYQNEITVNFSNVREIRRMYDHEHFFNNVEMGYKKWQSEDVSGIDDPQTKRTWASRFKKLGKKISILSEFIAAGLTTEKTRRTTREKSADYKYDNDVFIIAINPVPVDISPETSPDVIDYEPELNENFTSVTNLNNSDSRYNLRLTPGRNFLRWLNYLSGCLQQYVTSVFSFSSGEGNYDMRSTMIDTSPDCNDPADYAGAQLSEKGSIGVSPDYLFIPIPIEISIPMEWEEYKMIDRKKAIGISQTTENHEAFFIKTLEYKIAQGTAEGVLWPKDIFALSIVNDVPATNVCVPVEAQECGILLETGEFMLTESGDLMILEEC